MNFQSGGPGNTLVSGRSGGVRDYGPRVNSVGFTNSLQKRGFSFSLKGKYHVED